MKLKKQVSFKSPVLIEEKQHTSNFKRVKIPEMFKLVNCIWLTGFLIPRKAEVFLSEGPEICNFGGSKPKK